MKITVINGTQKRGVTYKLTQEFLKNFNNAQITEYFLPQDCPEFCLGCTSCFMRGEDTCKDYERVHEIEKSMLEADLLVMTSPAYVFHTTGAMKALLDHFAYRWMPHRPAPEFFSKRAVIITQCLGAGAKSCAKDIKHSLSWWGISKIGSVSCKLLSDVNWENVPKKRRDKIILKVHKLSNKFAKINYFKPAHTCLAVKIKFAACRLIQKSLYSQNPDYKDASYWHSQGWLNKSRPWKKTEKI